MAFFVGSVLLLCYFSFRLDHINILEEVEMKVPIDEMRDLCKRILLSHELTEDEAMIISDDYLDAEMRGKPSHGLKAFSVVVEDTKNRGKAAVGLERGPVILYEGNGDIGHLLAHDAILWAEKSCQNHGIAIVGMRNIRRFATPGTVARRATEKGMIALVFEYGGQAFMAPYGAAEAVISTNPIGIGIPTNNAPLILDMATSQRAFYFIALAKALGETIPDTWGIDSNGQPVTDPSQVTAVLPFGGYKGYALAVMLEILTGPFLGVDVGLQGDLSRRGALCLFFSPSLFGVDKKAFNARLDTFINNIKKARVAQGHEEIFLPGEQGERRRGKCLQEGVVAFDEQAINQLKALAQA
jgi:LDH2 family malate/lactate/ureidoglycolate dehydrogenase